MKKHIKTKVKKPTTNAKKARIDRSILFIILMSPVTKEPIPKADRAIKKILSSIEPVLNSRTFSESKRMFNTTTRMKAAARPIDHLPRGVFGRMVIRMFIISFDT
jgi:hypothetical protein